MPASPDTLPADFFSQQQDTAPSAAAPDTLPADFFAEGTAKAPRSVGDFLLHKLPASIGNAAKGIYTTFRHPIDTLRNAADITAGVLNQLGTNPDERGDFTPDAKAATAKAQALEKTYAQRYGSWEGFKNALYNDPAQVLSDLATIASPALEETGAIKAVTSKVPEVTVVPKFSNPNAADAAATAFGQANEIPVSAATATGNKFVAGIQKAADYTPIGSVVAQKAHAAESAAFERVGGELADQVNPTSVAPAQAGRDITSSIENTISTHNAEANAQYAKLREIEADPANIRNVQVGTKQVPHIDPQTGQTIPDKFDTVPDMQDVPLPVDLLPVKKMLKPVYDQIMRQLPITQQRASAGIKALENIIQGPDAAPVSQVDMDLGTIKAAARGADLPELRTLSQGLAAKAVSTLSDAVTDAVGKAERSAPAGATNAQVPTAPGVPVSSSTGAAAQSGSAQQSAALSESAGPGAQGVSGPGAIITIPGEPNNTYAANYEVKELADIQPSHQGSTFQPNPRYQIRNDRNYNNPANQRKVVDWSTPAQFDPKYHITDNPDATNGPPIVDSAGNVLGGNGRTMILQRVYASNPAGAQAYRDLLAERLPQFGLDPAQLKGMKEPVLVRTIDDGELAGSADKQNAITDFNKTGTAALTPAERAIADSRRVSADTVDHVADLISKQGPDGTLAQAIEGAQGRELMQRLISDGVVSPQEGAGMMTETALTKAGKDRVSQLMLGRFFRDPDQFENFPAALRNKIERAAAPLARTEAEGDYNLTPHVQSAIDLLETARAHGAGTLDDYLDQAGLFAREQFGPEAIELARAIKNNTPTALTEAVRQYAESARYAGDYQGPGLFGDQPDPLSPRGAFNDAFGSKLPERPATEAAKTPEVPAPSAQFSRAFTPPAAASAPKAAPRPRGVPAGQEALDALAAGRTATAAKYDAASVLKSLPKGGDEGRQVFDQALWAKDAGIEQLRRVAKLTPNEIPRLARANLEEIFAQATDKPGTAYTRWQNLGPETKSLLYPHPMLRENLDNFFRLAKRAAENPNPSGSALVGSVVAGAGYAFTNPATGIPMLIGAGALSKLLHSPAGIAALTNGLKISVGDKVAAGLAAGRILKIAGQAAQPTSAQLAAQAPPSQQTAAPELTASR